MNSESQRDVSFDPRSWAGPEAGGTGAPSPSPPRPVPRPASAPNGDKLRWTLAAVASIVILIVGAGLARTHRSAAPVATSAAAG